MIEDWNRPLVILGGLAPQDRAPVRDYVRRLGAPVYAEALSGLREDPALDHLILRSGERILRRGDFDGVLRIGHVPVLRFWRDLDTSLQEIPVVSVSTVPFAGLSRGELRQGKIASLLPERAPCAFAEELFRIDRERADGLREILEAEPSSELAIFRALSLVVPQGSRVYLGNSLPIREWDLGASREPRDVMIEANRGANGIDGQLSTFFGWCQTGAPNIAIVGDLTAIYDLGAPWIVSQLAADVRFLIVIINNGGGKIFARVPSLRALDVSLRERVIENAHAINFRGWASMWGLAYEPRQTIEEPLPSFDRGVVEILPDRAASDRVWERYDEMWGT